ncbi:WD40/YVTN/BNR-like repeat-containing protein [Alkalihalobacterium bogoriense]|uniref:WD40/YVTN/BNR-like repeat-containing protein n=1 Tax=Alkalihalobacterium bogoriense TaxID=246272 RepID=UPI00047D2F60|nr:hypothetical protein [Alkalihalobacterium bogoriense]
MMKLMSATAVTMSKQGSRVLATKEGLFLKKGGTWKRSLHNPGRTIRDLVCNHHHIYGVGDNGLFISSYDEGDSWSIQQFPTKASVWSIVTDSLDLLITHGDKVIYLSTNAGKSWTPYYPFQFSNAPSIRSLSLYKNKLFIGTKIHPIYGGIWCFDLQDKRTTFIKKEKKQMISSIITVNNQLIAATGSCRREFGKILVCHLSKIMDIESWEECSGWEDQSFLDLNESEGIIYATSTQNHQGISTISKVCVKQKEIVPCNYIRGHGWRICNDKEDYIVAGLYESMEFTKDQMQNYVM